MQMWRGSPSASWRHLQQYCPRATPSRLHGVFPCMLFGLWFHFHRFSSCFGFSSCFEKFFLTIDRKLHSLKRTCLTIDRTLHSLKKDDLFTLLSHMNSAPLRRSHKASCYIFHVLGFAASLSRMMLFMNEPFYFAKWCIAAEKLPFVAVAKEIRIFILAYWYWFLFWLIGAIGNTYRLKLVHIANFYVFGVC